MVRQVILDVKKYSKKAKAIKKNAFTIMLKPGDYDLIKARSDLLGYEKMAMWIRLASKYWNPTMIELQALIYKDMKKSRRNKRKLAVTKRAPHRRTRAVWERRFCIQNLGRTKSRPPQSS